MIKTVILSFLICMLTACTAKVSPESDAIPSMEGIFAFTALSDSGYTDLYVKNQDGTVNLSASWKISTPSRPSFSANGKTLYFQGRENSCSHIYAYDIESGNLPVCLTKDISVDCKEPFSGEEFLVFNKNGQIALMDLSSRKVSTLTFGKTAHTPVLSPDGKTVVYVDGEGTYGKLIKLDIQSLSSRSTGSGDCANPVFWDDDKLAWERSGKGISADGGTSFPAGTYPHTVSREWCIFSEETALYIGNLRTGEKHLLLEGLFKQCVYSDANVTVATPEDGGKMPEEGDIIESDTKRPSLGGRLVFHNYTSYDAMDSRMYIYDFAENDLQEISRSWTNVKHPMNGHFSRDGKYIVFMGIGTKTNSWDIFLYEIGSSADPRNLTPDGNYRDEDPKFAHNSYRICFKRNDSLSEIDPETGTISVLSRNDAASDPYSMPYYTVDDSKLVFGGGHNPNSYIGLWDIRTSSVTKLYDKTGTVEYYPVTIDATSFYYTQHVSPSDAHDQLYKGFFDGSPSKSLAFNKTSADYSDACPVNNGWLILVSTRNDSMGGYDLYIANETSGAIFPLSDYNSSINTPKNELGPDYTTAR